MIVTACYFVKSIESVFVLVHWQIGCELPVTEPVSFHGLITVSATEASLLLDLEYGMLYLQNSDMTSALDSLGAN